MKRRYHQAFEVQEEIPSKRIKLNDGTIKVIQYNNEKIHELISNQEKIIKEFNKVVSQLKGELNNSKKRVEKLEETVEKQQLVLREVLPPTNFSSSPASYYN